MRAFDFLTFLDHSGASGQDLLKKGLISLVESPGNSVMITKSGRDALGRTTITSDGGVSGRSPAFAHSVMPRGLPKSGYGISRRAASSGEHLLLRERRTRQKPA